MHDYKNNLSLASTWLRTISPRTVTILLFKLAIVQFIIAILNKFIAELNEPSCLSTLTHFDYKIKLPLLVFWCIIQFTCYQAELSFILRLSSTKRNLLGWRHFCKHKYAARSITNEDFTPQNHTDRFLLTCHFSIRKIDS